LPIFTFAQRADKARQLRALRLKQFPSLRARVMRRLQEVEALCLSALSQPAAAEGEEEEPEAVVAADDTESEYVDREKET
jgi:hypothetical protein